MKQIFLATVLICLFLAATAQTLDSPPKEKKIKGSTLEFSAGYSFAIGKYSGYDQSQEKSGYAGNGYQVSVGFNWMGKKNLGLAIQYIFQKNPLKDTAARVMIPGLKNTTLGDVPWTNHYLLFGPVYMKTIGKFYIEAKVLGGIVFSWNSVFYTPNPADTTMQQYDKNIAKGFAYHVSAGAGWMISPHMTVKFNVGLLGGWPQASKSYNTTVIGYEQYIDPVTGIRYYKPVYSSAASYSFKKVISTINPVIGLVYHF